MAAKRKIGPRCYECGNYTDNYKFVRINGRIHIVCKSAPSCSRRGN